MRRLFTFWQITNDGISMNVRTLKRKLRHYGLRRRNHLHSEHTVREIIKRKIEGPLSPLGFRGMWNKPRTTYLVTVPRDIQVVMKILWELDPDASALRRARKLQRWSYVSPGPMQLGMSIARDKTFFFNFQNFFFFSISKIFLWISWRFLDCKLFWSFIKSYLQIQ